MVDVMAVSDRAFLRNRTVRTSFIQHLPFARRRFRLYLGLMPIAVEQFDLRGYDLVVSSSHAVAKGVITGPGQVHVSYVHSPMRYAWDLQHQYLQQAGLTRGLKSIYARWLLSRMRQWDAQTAIRVDYFIANSQYIAERIWKVYRRESSVIHPPVDVAGFALSEIKADYYLVVSRQVPYKRIDIIAQAFASMPDRKLLIVGDGPEHSNVLKAAEGAPNISIQGAVSQHELVELMQSARAFIVAAEEDFGISMVEAQACGTPVIAFGRGGARDIVVAAEKGPPTGLLFEQQSSEAIIEAVEAFERMGGAIEPVECRLNAMRFTETLFRDRIRSDIVAAMQ